jgi:transposase
VRSRGSWCGTGPRPITSCDLCCASSTRRSWPRSPRRPAAPQRPEARALLAVAPTPAAAAKLTKAQIRAALRRAGRKRGIDAETERLASVFRAEYLRQPPLVEHAYSRKTVALVRILEAACVNADELAVATETAFGQHPDAAIITSFPGLACLSGARILAEIGDDRTRFADAKALKAYAGSAPVTRASGKSTTVLARRVKNRRLAAVSYMWVVVALSTSPGARAHYDRRREHGEHHNATTRNLFNRFLGMLHHCLQTGQPYDEHHAFPNQPPRIELVAA